MSKHPALRCVLTLAILAALTGSALCHELSNPSKFPPIAELRKHGCVPKDNTARILQSAHPNDLVPRWSGDNYLGTAWSFLPKRYEETDLEGGIFLQGDLIATRGGTTDRNVFILYNEWDCSP